MDFWVVFSECSTIQKSSFKKWWKESENQHENFESASCCPRTGNPLKLHHKESSDTCSFSSSNSINFGKFFDNFYGNSSLFGSAWLLISLRFPFISVFLRAFYLLVYWIEFLLLELLKFFHFQFYILIEI